MNERKLAVDPQLIFGISLLVALAISWRGLMGAMHGSADIMTVGVRFLIAVAVVWTGLFSVASLLASYAAASQSRSDASDETDRRRVIPTITPMNRELEADAAAAAAIAAETESAAG